MRGPISPRAWNSTTAGSADGAEEDVPATMQMRALGPELEKFTT